MKKFIQEYLKVIAYSIMGIVFGYASFYLFLNMYHYNEIGESYSIDMINSPTHVNIQNNINTINENINFDINRYNGPIEKQVLLGFQGRLKLCAQDLGSKEYYDFIALGDYNVIDAQDFLNLYNSKVSNSCLVLQLTDLFALHTDELMKIDGFDTIYDMSQIQIKLLTNGNSYIQDDMENNSSYYFNSLTAKNTTFNQVNSAIYSTMFDYDNAVSYVLLVSELFKEEVNR